jgi:RNA polymerase sigma factor (sigma-70 family)
MDLAAANLRLFLPESELSVTPSDTPRSTPQLWEQNAQQLAGLIRALGIPSDRVDDLLQELYLQSIGFLSAVANRDPANHDAPSDDASKHDEARRWLFRVATNRCRLEHRRRGRWQRLLERFAAWSGTAQDTTATQNTAAVEDRQRSAEIDAALDRLPPAQREVVVLRYFCELNSREIGEVLQMPEATIRSHLAKARRQLARDLADWNEP